SMSAHSEDRSGPRLNQRPEDAQRQAKADNEDKDAENGEPQRQGDRRTGRHAPAREGRDEGGDEQNRRDAERADEQAEDHWDTEQDGNTPPWKRPALHILVADAFDDCRDAEDDEK